MPRSRSRSRTKRRRRSSRGRSFSRDSIASARYRAQTTNFAGFNSNKSYIPSSRSYTGFRAKQVKDFMRDQHWLNKSLYASTSKGPGEYSRKTPETDEMLSKLGLSHERKSPRSKPRSM